MTQWHLFAALVIGIPVLLFLLATIFPCEGCRLRRARIARAIAHLREKEKQTD